jgi:hypothetical protein
LASSRAEIKGLVATPGKRMSNQEKEQTMGWGKGSVFELAMRILEDHMSKEAEKRLHFGLPRRDINDVIRERSPDTKQEHAGASMDESSSAVQNSSERPPGKKRNNKKIWHP